MNSYRDSQLNLFEKWLFLPLFIVIQSITFAQQTVIIKVKNTDNKPIENAVMYYENNPIEYFECNTNGIAEIPLKKETLIIKQTGYLSKEIVPTNENTEVILERHLIELNTVEVNLKSSRLNIKDLIEEIKFGKLGLKKPSYFLNSKGKHKVTILENDSVFRDLEIRNFKMEINKGIFKNDIGFETPISLTESPKIKGKKYTYTIPYNSSIFLSQSINMFNVYDLDFLNNVDFYNYEIYESQKFFKVIFKPKKQIKWGWYGHFHVEKDKFWISKLNLSLHENPDNVRKVKSAKSNKKDPSSLLFTKTYNLEIDFIRTENEILPSEIITNSEIIHKIKKRKEFYKLLSESYYSFTKAEKAKIKKNSSLNNTMYYLFYY